jgi:hypothetical protein
MCVTPKHSTETELASLQKIESCLSRVSSLLPFVALGALPLMFVLQRFCSTCVAVLFFAILCALMLVIRSLDWRINQVRRAALLIKGRSDNRPPILILRSFSADGLAFRPRQYGDYTIYRGHSYLNDLARAASEFGQPIAIGAPSEVTGHSFAKQDLLYFQSSEASWLEMFSLAAQGARAVILIPGTTGGLLQEVSALRSSSRLAKIILFMPPTPTGIIRWLDRYSGPEEIPRNWERVRASWKDLAIELPVYRNSGMLFVLNSIGSVELNYDLNGSVDCVDVRPIGTLIQRVITPSAPLNELIVKLERLEIAVRRPSILRQLLGLVFLGH